MNITDQKHERNVILAEMETEFDKHNISYFKKMIFNKDNVLRTRAVCILAEIGGSDAVEPISEVLNNDNDDLVRHEAAFSLGQLGCKSAVTVLCNAVLNDKSFFVRHEAAVALGVIGDENARETLNNAFKEDESDEVKNSAIVALSNLDYILYSKKYNQFTRLTGG
ncbi:MAG: HEAT repeat domain-containing protein [Nitrososphaeraceae archaeon]